MFSKDRLYCICCGADITRAIKIYPKGYKGGAYCYDCSELYTSSQKRKKKSKKKETAESKSLTAKVKRLYDDGLYPSEIARAVDISAEEVYRILGADYDTCEG